MIGGGAAAESGGERGEGGGGERGEGGGGERGEGGGGERGEGGGGERGEGGGGERGEGGGERGEGGGGGEGEITGPARGSVVGWTAHPARRRPEDAMLAAFVVLATAYAVLVSLGSALLAVLAVVLLAASIGPFLLPTRYRIDDEQLTERRLFVRRSRPWSELRRVEVGAAAARVSPYARPRWLDRYRAITVILPVPGDGADRGEVVRALRERVRT